jgi:hypothetical protein
MPKPTTHLEAINLYTINGVVHSEWVDVTGLNINHWLGY